MEKDNFSFPIQCKHGTKRMMGCAVEKMYMNYRFIYISKKLNGYKNLKYDSNNSVFVNSTLCDKHIGYNKFHNVFLYL